MSKQRFVVLVCGSHLHVDRPHVFEVLNRLHARRPITCIVHGNAPNVDRTADDWALDNGVTVERYPADWNRLGKLAGLLRNEVMLNAGRPDLVLHFPGGRGTADMVARAKRAGVKTQAGGMRTMKRGAK